MDKEQQYGPALWSWLILHNNIEIIHKRAMEISIVDKEDKMALEAYQVCLSLLN